MDEFEKNEADLNDSVPQISHEAFVFAAHILTISVQLPHLLQLLFKL